MDPRWSAPPDRGELDEYVRLGESYGINTSLTAEQLEEFVEYQAKLSLFETELDGQLPWPDNQCSYLPPTNHVPNPYTVPFDIFPIDQNAGCMFNPPNIPYAPPMDHNLFYDEATETNPDFSDDIRVLATPPMYCSPDLHEIPQNSPQKAEKPLKKKPPRSFGPTPSKNWTVTDAGTGKHRPPLLFEFLRELLDDSDFAHIAEYVDRHQGTFKFYDKDQAAKLWQEAKGRNCESEMTYEKFSRGIRHYYEKGIMRRCHGRFTFRFDVKSGFGTEWTPAYR